MTTSENALESIKSMLDDLRKSVEPAGYRACLQRIANDCLARYFLSITEEHHPNIDTGEIKKLV